MRQFFSGLLFILLILQAPVGFAEDFEISTVVEFAASVTTANGNSEDNTLTLAAGTYTIDDSFPDLTGEMTITGSGSDPSKVILTRETAGTVLTVAIRAEITLQGITVADGDASFGGGILNSGDLTIEDSIVRNNNASTIGGGIYQSDGNLTLTRVTIRNNEADSSGGGIFINGGSVSLNRVSIYENLSGSSGGGIANQGGTEISVLNTTFAQNQADSDGGGFYNTASTTITLAQSTFCENEAGNQGGGLFLSSGANTTFESTVFDNNTADTAAPNCRTGNAANLTESLGSNFLSNSSFCFLDEQDSDMLNAGDLLDAFEASATPAGGHCELLDTSNAINNGPSNCEDDDSDDTDQLGEERSDECDAGAVEFQGTPADTDGDGLADFEDDDDDGDGIPDEDEENPADDTDDDDDSSDDSSSSSGCSLNTHNDFPPTQFWVVLLVILFHGLFLWKRHKLIMKPSKMLARPSKKNSAGIR